MKNTPKFYLQTFGCQMNHNDSERIAGLLLPLGFEKTDLPEEADLILLNSCSIRKSAEDRVFGMVRNWVKLREQKPKLIIGITGCMPGRDHAGKMRAKFPGVNLFFPIAELAILPKRLFTLNPDLFGVDPEDLADYFSINPNRQEKHRAYVAVQTGCNNFCTYCVVPYARGREKNRPVEDILTEIKLAVANGAKEIMLLGQVVNNYKSTGFQVINPFNGKDDYAALLWEINQIKGVERITWIAADPQYFNDYQIQALTLPKQVKYLHLPVQSGDNEVLKRMNRHYTREYYIDLIKRIRKACPDIAIGTDIIVGFCGETEEEFQNTLDLYRQCDFDISFHAQYSERSGTVAAKAFDDDVPLQTKKARWDTLQNLMEEIVVKKNAKLAGKKISVLVDKCEDGFCSGNSSEMKFSQFLGDEKMVGEIVEVKVIEPEMWRLKGEIIE